MSLTVSPDFRAPRGLETPHLQWLDAWSRNGPDAYLAQAAVLRDPDADGGMTLALVLDLRQPLEREQESVFLPFTVLHRPKEFVHRPDLETSNFPARYVVAVEMARVNADVRAGAES